MKTASCKAKGRSTQKFVCSTLIAMLGLEEGDVESRSSGAVGVDIMMSPKARNKLPLSIECKHTRKHPSYQEYKQSLANTKPDTIPAIVWQPHGRKEIDSMITMKFTEFVELWMRMINYE